MVFRSLADDAISSVRRIRRHPRNTIVLIFMLAVAVGSMIGIFHVAYQALHGELRYRQPQRIVVAAGDVSDFLVSPYNWQPNPMADAIFEGVAEYHLESANLNSESGPQRLFIACVTPRFFSVLGVRMALGGDLSNTQTPSPSSPIPWLPIIISHDMWRNYFGSDRGIVGRAITLTLLYPYHFQVVGVAPPGVRFPPGVDGWIPEHLTSSSLIQTTGAQNWSNATVALLRPGLSVVAAEAAIRSWPRSTPMWIWNGTTHLVPLRQFLVGKFYNLGPLLWLVTIFFLGLAVATAASIFRIDFEGRRDEFRVRKILGATPGRLFRMLSLEMTAILLFALAASFLVRFALLSVTAGYLHLPFVFGANITWVDLAMAVSTVGAIAVLIGAVQGHGLRVFRFFFYKLKSKPIYEDFERSPVSRYRFPVQVVPATMILVTAILLVRSAYDIMHIDPGVQPKGAFVCEVPLPLDKQEYVFGGIGHELPAKEVDRQVKIRLDQFNRLTNFYFSLIVQRMREHAGVIGAGVISISPYSSYPVNTLDVYASRTPEQTYHSEPMFPAHLVSMNPGAVPALGMKIIYGRSFNDQAGGGADEDGVIINEAMAQRIGPGATSLGQYVMQPSRWFPPARILGIVQNVHETNLFTPVVPTVYYPFSEFGLPDVDVVFRTSRDMPFQDAYSLVQSSVRSVVPGAIVTRFESLNDMVSSAGTLTRYSAYFLLALAMLGVFMAGICAWAKSVAEIRRREHEIGIRLALGAEAGQIIRLIVGGQVGASLLAASIGAVIAWWFSRLAGYLFHGVHASGIGNYLLGVISITAYVSLIFLWAVRGTVRRNPSDLIGTRSL